MAATSVQGQKLRIPTTSGQVPPRLVDAVLDTPAGGVTLLVAAPGYGRTTVAALASAASGEPVAWVSVDAVDTAPGRLLTHIEAATDVVVTGAPPLSGDRADDVARWDALLDRWSSAPPMWLVLDDLHHALGPATVPGLSYLMARCPPTVRMVITSRTELPALTGDLRTSPGFRVLDEVALSLTPVETAQSLVAAGIAVDEAQGARLVRLCAGWPAAGAGAAGPPAAPGHQAPLHELASWLVGPGTEQLLADWWRRLREPAAEFLLDTVVLPRLHPEVCDLLRGGSGSGDVLYELVAEHAFLRPAQQDDVLGWVRHPLLTELLRHRAGSRPLDPVTLRAVARWAEAHADVDTRVRALVAAGDVEEATALVRHHEERFIQEGRTTEVLQWHRLLPPGAVSEQAGMLLRNAWMTLLAGDVTDARILHGMLRGVLEEDPRRPDPELVGDEAVLAGHLALCDAAPARVLADAQRAEAAFDGAWTRPAHQSVDVLRTRGLLWLGRTDEAAHQVATMARRPGAVPLLREIQLPALAAGVAVAQGRMHDARGLAAQVLAAIDAGLVPGASLGLLPALLCRGQCAADLGDPEPARADLLEVVAESRQLGMLGYEVLALTALARLEWAAGDILASIELVRRGHQALDARTPTSPLVHHLNAVEALTRISVGDAARAERLLALLPPRPATTLLSVRLAQLRRPGSGATRLERLVTTHPRDRSERDLLMASALAGSHRAEATRRLLDAAELADRHGLMTLLVGAGEPVLDLAREEARRSADDSLTRLLGVAERTPARVRGDLHVSAGERDLLALLPSRASNEAIAASLGVSVNTVKTRLRRLYAKLDVGRRDDAVRVARERGLID